MLSNPASSPAAATPDRATARDGVRIRSVAPDFGPTGRTFPGARRPDRSRWVDSAGLAIAAYEWGAPDAPVILAVHGGFDFAGTFDVFAPLLADAGYRVVSWDARGHGGSEHATLYSWGADLRDAAAVLESCGVERVVVLGHSKGGGIVLEMAHALPHRLSHLINLDGLPSRNSWPDLADHDRTRMLRDALDGWLGHRRKANQKERRPGTLEELAARRQKMNPRLPIEWLQYLVPIGAEQVAGDDAQPNGWRWKIDPALRLGGFGPWRPEWSMQRLPGVGVPVLGVLGMEMEMMGWGTKPPDVYPNLPPGAEFHPLDGVGHFVHIEQSEHVAGLVLDFLARHPDGPASGPAAAIGGGEAAADDTAPVPAEPAGANIIWLRHGRSMLALHLIREGWGRPLLILPGLGESAPAIVPPHLDRWGGPVYALEVTGHGRSSRPPGGGYTAEILMADVDAALAHLGSATIYGRGLGAYLGLLAGGARPADVHGVILADGPGLVGGGIRPASVSLPGPLPTSAPGPDPFVLLEMSRDVRPPDYVTEFVRLMTQASPLDWPISVCTVVRPEWLAAVADTPGVRQSTIDEALGSYGDPAPGA